MLTVSIRQLLTHEFIRFVPISHVNIWPGRLKALYRPWLLIFPAISIYIAPILYFAVVHRS